MRTAPRIHFRAGTPAAICETSIRSTSTRSDRIASSDVAPKSFASRTGSGLSESAYAAEQRSYTTKSGFHPLVSWSRIGGHRGKSTRRGLGKRNGRERRLYPPMALAVSENTLLAWVPTNRIVPTTMTRMTANMTAYSAMSCPSSSDQQFRRSSNI